MKTITINLSDEAVEILRRNYTSFECSGEEVTAEGPFGSENIFKYFPWDSVDPRSEDKVFMEILQKISNELNSVVNKTSQTD